jgi:hypothetical protein
MAATGIAPEDDDGNAASKKRDPHPTIENLLKASSLDDLKNKYALAYKAYQNDKESLALIEQAKNTRKQQLLEIDNAN